MAKKIKRSNTSAEPVDIQLEEVGEERAFEVELDEEENEIVFVNHYRRKWGDGFNADVEHGLNFEEAMELVGTIINMIESVKNKIMVEKSTPEPIEKNPLKDGKTQ